MYDTKGTADEIVHPDDEASDDVEEEKAKPPVGSVRKEEIWREMFLTSNGRDKAFVRSHMEVDVDVLILRLLTEINAIFHPIICPLP